MRLFDNRKIKSIALALLFCLVGAADAYPLDLCERVWRSLAERGIKDEFFKGQRARISVVRASGFDIPTGSKVFKLGEGAEAVVYRVIPPSGDTFILRHHAKNLNDRPVQSFWSSMQFLKELEKAGEHEYKIASVEQSSKDEHWFKLSDTEGYLLEDVLDTLTKDHPLTPELLHLYDTRAQNIQKRAKEEWQPRVRVNWEENVTPGGVDYKTWYISSDMKIPRQPNDLLMIGNVITPYNIIVDIRTLEMTIIDPI